MHKRFLEIGFFVVFYCIALSSYIFIGSGNMYSITNVLYTFTPFMATVSAGYALYRYGFQGDRTKTFFLLTLGMLCWFLGEITYDFYQYILVEVPYPSFADVFFLLSYPLLLIGLLNELQIAHLSWSKITSANKFLFLVLTFLLSILVIYFGIYKAFNPDETLVSNIVAMAYGVGDFILLMAVMLLLVYVLEFREGLLFRTWFSLFLSFSCIIVGDILFALYNDAYQANNTFYKTVIDSFYMFGYIFFAHGMIEFTFSLEQIRKRFSPREHNLT